MSRAISGCGESLARIRPVRRRLASFRTIPAQPRDLYSGISADGTLVRRIQDRTDVRPARIRMAAAQWPVRAPHAEGSVHAFATSINPRGDVVGRLIDAAATATCLKWDKKGRYSILQVPRASLTNARGINPKGRWWSVCTGQTNHGLIVGQDDLTGLRASSIPWRYFNLASRDQCAR